MDERLKQQLEFVLEIDKEKNIFRQTHLSGQGRNENDAEHAWHMAIMAYLLREYSNEPVDIGRVMLMCLIHDIVEIDAGDTENKPMVIGGGTYAKSLKNIIAFGPEMPGIDYRIHSADEYILVSGMEESVLIYMEAIKNLLAI